MFTLFIVILTTNHFRNTRTAKDDTHLSFHNSRTNLINDRDVYIEDVIDERELVDEDHGEHQQEQFRRSKVNRQQRKHYDNDEMTIQRHQIDDDSMRRHEIDRGSDIDYNTARSSLKNKREFFIKDGNVEILQLITRDRTRDVAAAAEAAGVTDDDNIYVNVPLKNTSLSHPQLLMVDNNGKEILMRRFIEQQPDGKQIIREHYQIVPGATYIQAMPNEIQQNSTLKGDTFPLGKSGPNSIVYSQTEPEVKVIHTQPAQGALQVDGYSNQMQPATSNQSLTQELENSLKQQNELLRQILMEKEKVENRYVHHDLALETQSLPGQSMAIATQTEREACTQTETGEGFIQRTSVGTQGRTMRRRARSENDDSASDDGDYEYIRLSSPNSPDGVVYCIKRRKPRRRGKYRNGSHPHRRIVMVEEVKRKIRTPIKEEEDEEYYKARKRATPKKPPRNNGDTKASILRRLNNDEKHQKLSSSHHKEPLNRDILMEISDSLDEAYDSKEKKKKRKIRVKQLDYYSNQSDEEEYQHINDDVDYSNDSDEREIIIKSSAFTPKHQGRTEKELKRNSSQEHRFEIHVGERSVNGNNLVSARNSSNSRSSSENRTEAMPEPKPRISRSDSSRASNVSQRNIKRNETSSEPPKSRVSITKYQSSGENGTQITTTKIPENRISHSETDLLDRDEGSYGRVRTGSIPKYMEWYYDKKKPSISGRTSTESSTKGGQPTRKKIQNVNGPEKKISKTRLHIKHVDGPATNHDDSKFKPEPAPRKSPPKGNRLLKEDIVKNKQLKPRIETDMNHPLVQHSEHRFERENNPEVPAPPTKLPHYIYPETPPTFATTRESSTTKLKPKPSPIKENEVKLTNTASKVNLYIEDSNTTHPTTNSSSSVQKQLNAATLEDDHDSGIAMNSLLNSMGRRNPIAEKKSVFSIAYDDVSRVQKITSGGESPPQY